MDRLDLGMLADIHRLGMILNEARDLRRGPAVEARFEPARVSDR